MPDVPPALAERINGETFAEWYREQQWAENIRKGQPYFNGPSSVPPAEKHSPSQLLQCHRKIFYRQENALKEQEEPTGIYWAGNQFEEEIAVPYLQHITGENTYVRNSIWVDFTVETEAGEVWFKGETDPCIVDRHSRPILPTEIKTKDEVDYLEEPNRHHLAQIHAYLYGLNQRNDQEVEKAIILYGARKTMKIQAFHIEFDRDFWGEVVRWAAEHTQHREQDQLPPADPAYGWECKFCSYKHRCGQSDEPYADEGPHGFLPGVDDYPRRQVLEYLQAKDDACLTPTLAQEYPDLVANHEVADWSCPQCKTSYSWNAAPLDDSGSMPPVCPACAEQGELSTLILLSPAG